MKDFQLIKKFTDCEIEKVGSFKSDWETALYGSSNGQAELLLNQKPSIELPWFAVFLA